MIHRYILSILSISVFIFTGCASIPRSYQVTVDSINNKEVLKSKKCVIMPALRDVYSEDLQFKEFAIYLERALKSKGYDVVQATKNADIVVFLAYGTGEIRDDMFFFDMPFNEEETSKIFGNVSAYGNSSYYQENLSFSKSGDLSRDNQSLYYNEPAQQNSTFIILRAYDLKLFRESKQEKQLWRTDIIINSSNGDLRYEFPFLIAAAIPYIGEDTKHKVDITISENDKNMLTIKGN